MAPAALTDAAEKFLVRAGRLSDAASALWKRKTFNLRFSRLFLEMMALTRLLAIFLYHFPNPPQTHMALVRLENFYERD